MKRILYIFLILTFTLGSILADEKYAQADEVALVTLAGSGEVAFVSIQPARVLKKVKLGIPWPAGGAITPDGKTAIIVGTAHMCFVDIQSMTLTHTLPLLTGPEQHGITLQPNEFAGVAITPNGETALITEGNEWGQLFFVDVDTMALSGEPIYLGDDPAKVLTKSTSNEAYVLDGSNIYTVDLSTRTYVMDSLPVATDEISDIALTPDESRAVFIDLDNWIYLLDTSNGTLVDQKQVNLIRFTEPSQVAISPDGTMAIIANATDHSITFVEVNASSLNIVDIIDVGGGPTGVAFTQNGQIAVITLPIEGLIQIIDVANRTITATIMDDLGIAPLGLSIVDIGTAPPPFVIHKGDLDEDGDVDSTDLATFAAEYGWPHLP